MRAFIVMCLVAVACADKLGYNYQPVGHSDSGLSFGPGVGLGGGSLGGGSLGGGIIGGGSIGGGSIGGGSIGGGSIGGGSIGGGSIGGGNIGGGNIGGGSIGGGFGGFENVGTGIGGGSIGGGFDGGKTYDAPAELNKEFFTYSANEQEFDDGQNAAKEIANLKQNLRVIFIKGPENKGLENAALALAKQASNDQTAIYVLNKQADIGDLANKLNAIRSENSHKPEVHFVKYRTPEDAANAQQQIQSQYDGLGGSSQSHEGGIAPVINFASQAPVRTPTANAPGNSYLPTSIFRRRL